MAYRIPKGCSLFQRRNDERWKSRIMVNGKQVFVACCKDKGIAYKKLIEKYNLKKKNKLKAKETFIYTVHLWIDHWFNTYKLGTKKQLAQSTLDFYKYHIKNFQRKSSERPH